MVSGIGVGLCARVSAGGAVRCDQSPEEQASRTGRRRPAVQADGVLLERGERTATAASLTLPAAVSFLRGEGGDDGIREAANSRYG